MKATLIGIAVGIAAIAFIASLRGLDRRTLYGLALTGIAFLYVGFTWSDPLSLAINIVQALIFVFLSYYGINKSTSILIAGYFLHGAWDLVYTYLPLPALRPPHYDLFCLAIDFTMGLYLVMTQGRMANSRQPFFRESTINK
ncbi:MAG: hypothetical protein JNL40_15105 [Cyclobacteriaceae bacterium]|nr:hypothetical protein [Cyclobacteriaceae bacterium]